MSRDTPVIQNYCHSCHFWRLHHSRGPCLTCFVGEEMHRNFCEIDGLRAQYFIVKHQIKEEELA